MENESVVKQSGLGATLGHESNSSVFETSSESVILRLRELEISLLLDDRHKSLEQQCAIVKRDYDRFLFEYKELEPELVRCDELMRKREAIGDCDVEDVRDALRGFRLTLFSFDFENIFNGAEFAKVTYELIDVINEIYSALNHTVSKIYFFNEDLEDGKEEVSWIYVMGTLEEIVRIDDQLEKMKTLMATFNVSPRNYLTETLERQLEAVHDT